MAATVPAAGSRIRRADNREAAGTVRRGIGGLPGEGRADTRVGTRVAEAADIPEVAGSHIPVGADSGRTLTDRPRRAAPVVGKSPTKASNEYVCWRKTERSVLEGLHHAAGHLFVNARFAGWSLTAGLAAWMRSLLPRVLAGVLANPRLARAELHH